MKPLGGELIDWAQGAGLFRPDELEIMLASYQAMLDRTASHAADLAADGPMPRGRPIDWAHDGSEIHVDGGVGYRCWRCRDSGFVRREVPVAHADFGKAIPCRCRTEDPAMWALGMRRRLNRSFMPPGLENKTLAAFRGVPGTQAAYQAAEGWRDRFEHGGEAGWLALAGATGCGKSHLLAGMALHALLTTEVQWVETPEWVRRCARDQFAAADGLIAAAKAAPVLVVDEFGSQQAGDWGRVTLEGILNVRYAARTPTLLGLTCTPKELADWSPRLGSRLQDKSLVRFIGITAADYRPRLERPT